MEERVGRRNHNQGQTLFGIIIVLIVVALFSASLYFYISKRTPKILQNIWKSTKEVFKLPEVSPPPEEVIPASSDEESTPTSLPEEAAPVSGSEKPAVQKCADGTLYGQCSINKPRYCDNGNLINKCSICSCLSGTNCKNNECIKAIDAPYLENNKDKEYGPDTNYPLPLLTGSLILLKSTAYPDQSITAPQLNLKLAEFSLTNNTTEPINLKTIEVDLATGSNLYITNLYVTNLYVVYGSNKTTTLETVSHNNYWPINFQLPIGQTIDLLLYGDVNSSIPAKSTIHSSILVTGVSTVSAVTVSTNSNAVLAGQNITFGTGLLAISKDSSSPPERILAVSQIGVAGKFQLKANYESYTISELKFVIPGSRASFSISDAVLSDSATQVLLVPEPVPVTFDGNNYIFDFNVDIPVYLNSSRSLTLYYDLSATIYPNIRNMNIAPVLVYIKATNSRGVLMDGAAINYSNIIASYNGITLPPGGVTVNGTYIYKSIPILTAVPLNKSASKGSNLDLYTFSIGADPNGDISVKQLMFSITITDKNNSYPYLNNFTFLKDTNDYTSSVAIGNTVNNNYINLANTGGIGIGTNTVVVTFNEEEVIPAGKTITYTLKANVGNFVKSATKGSDSISTFIPSDTAISNNGSCLRMVFTNIYGLAWRPQDISVVNYNLLWSDYSAFFPSHSEKNGFSSDDWYNGFKVLNFPLPTHNILAK